MHQIDAWTDSLPEPQVEIAHRVREIIIDLINGVEEMYSYKLPFYHYFGMFCYLTFNKKMKALDVTFIRGKDLAEVYSQLERRDRASAASIVLHKVADIHHLHLPEIITAAADWQQQAKQLNISFLKKK